MRWTRGRGGFVGAVQFLTRVPVRTAAPAVHERAVAWFPAIGVLVGAGVGGVYAGGYELTTVPAVAAALAVLTGLLITGAFHEDGLADIADAVAGAATPDERLRILDDPHHGTYGVAALTSSILLRVLALASMAPAVGFAAAVSAHALARAAAITTIGRVPTARPSGLGAAAAQAVREPNRTIGVAAGVAIAAAATGWWVAIAVPAAAIAAGLALALAVRAFGGINGDVLGAIEQVAEAVVLVTVAALAARHDLWWR